MTVRLATAISVLYLTNGKWVELIKMDLSDPIPEDSESLVEALKSIKAFFYEGTKVEMKMNNEHLVVRGIDRQTSIFKIIPVFF